MYIYTALCFITLDCDARYAIKSPVVYKYPVVLQQSIDVNRPWRYIYSANTYILAELHTKYFIFQYFIFQGVYQYALNIECTTYKQLTVLNQQIYYFYFTKYIATIIIHSLLCIT